MKSQRKVWRTAEVSLVKGALKERKAEDQHRADAWLKAREAVLGRTYDGMDVPGIPQLLGKAYEVMAPIIAEFNRLFAAAHPAEFAKATLGVHITPGGILDPKVREQVRRDATRHLIARHRFMVANSAGYGTMTVVEASVRATDNPEVKELLGRIAIPNDTTPSLEPPGPAIGMLKRLLPHPEEWGFAGYDANGSPLLSSSDKKNAEIKSLPAPKRKPGK